VTSDQPVNAMQAHFYSGLLLSACSLASDNTFTSWMQCLMVYIIKTKY
jgi:hypothetical protein